jgi:hypothetical protein
MATAITAPFAFDRMVSVSRFKRDPFQQQQDNRIEFCDVVTPLRQQVAIPLEPVR